MSRLRLGNAAAVVPLALIGPVAALGLVLSRSLVLVILAQVTLALLLAVIAIHVGKLLHDAVPSTVRTGVSSGVGTLSWLLFLPFSLVFGWLARAGGVGSSAWTILGATTVVAVLLVVPVLRPASAAVSSSGASGAQAIVRRVTSIDGAQVVPSALASWCATWVEPSFLGRERQMGDARGRRDRLDVVCLLQ